MEEALRPLRFLSTVSGMKASSSKIHGLCVAVLLIIVIVSVVLRQIIEPIDANKGIIIASVEYANYNFRIPLTLCCLIMTNRRAARIDEFIKTLDCLNKKFRTIAPPVDYGAIKRLIRKLTALLLIKVLIQQVPYTLKGHNYWDLVKILDYVVFSVPLFFVEVLLCQWITYLMILRANFKSLNALLKILRYQRCFQADDFRTIFKKRQNKREILQACGLIYGDLCEESENLNWVFGWQILALIPTLFVNVIFVSFQTCRMFKNQIEFNGGWIIFDLQYFAFFVELVKPAVLVREEADKFADILRNINNENDDIVNGLILQTHHQKVEFSACGVFPLDATLIYSIVGAVTTYLVILLQFDL